MRYSPVVLLWLAPLVLAAEPEAKEWVTVSPDGAGFRAVFPGVPTESSKPAGTKDPRAAAQRLTWAPSKELAFVVVYFDLVQPVPKDMEAKALENIRDTHAKNLKGEVASDSVVVRSGLAGRQFTLRMSPGSYYRSIVYLKNGRIFQAAVIGSEKAIGSKDADRFLKAFEVVTDKPK